MVDNVNKNNKCTPAMISSATTEDSVIVLHPRNNLWVWLVTVLLGGLLAGFFGFVFLTVSERDGSSRSSFVRSSPVVDSSALLRDVEFLKGRMNLLITGAMESKIEQLEHSLESGIISRNDLATIQELKEDLKALKAYSLQRASTTFGLLEESGNGTVPMHSGASRYSDELMHEIVNIKNLFYLSIASWGIAIAIFGGAWLRGQYRLRQIRNEHLFRREMLEKPKTGIY